MKQFEVAKFTDVTGAWKANVSHTMRDERESHAWKANVSRMR